MQRGAHGLAEPDLRQLQHAFYTGNSLQAAMVPAVAALPVRVDLSVPDFHQAAAPGVKKTPVGDDTRPNVMVDHHLNHITRTARRAKQGLRHGPGTDVMLNIDRHAGMVFQHLSQRHLFDIVVKRHAVHDAVFGINNARHGDGDCR